MARVKKATSKNPRTKAVTEITPEIADALSAEAERGYDLSCHKVWMLGSSSAPVRTQSSQASPSTW